MEAELGYQTTVVATGGIAKFVLPLCKREMIYDKDLLVKGLAILYRENRK
jgi:type III pantothenate kinase